MKSKKTTKEIMEWYDDNLKKGSIIYIDKLSLGKNIVNNELKAYITKSFSVFENTSV